MNVKGSKLGDRLPFITVISNCGFRPVLFRIAPIATLNEWSRDLELKLL